MYIICFIKELIAPEDPYRMSQMGLGRSKSSGTSPSASTSRPPMPRAGCINSPSLTSLAKACGTRICAFRKQHRLGAKEGIRFSSVDRAI